jgi:hypothetical protein
MARLYPTLLVVPLLAAACSTSPATRSQGDVSYLDGINTDYSIRASELQTQNFAALAKDLPDALVAGNEDFTLATSIFRKGNYLVLDLVIANHSSQELKLNRADIYVIDYMGTRLASLTDWKDGQNYGLRSRVNKGSEYTYVEGYGTTPRVLSQENPAPAASNKQGVGQNADPGSDMSSSLSDASAELDLLTNPVKVKRTDEPLPKTLVVQSGQKKPYWAYFKTKDLMFPVTAVIRLSGKRLIFRFQEPKRVAS